MIARSGSFNCSERLRDSKFNCSVFVAEQRLVRSQMHFYFFMAFRAGLAGPGCPVCMQSYAICRRNREAHKKIASRKIKPVISASIAFPRAIFCCYCVPLSFDGKTIILVLHKNNQHREKNSSNRNEHGSEFVYTFFVTMEKM